MVPGGLDASPQQEEGIVKKLLIVLALIALLTAGLAAPAAAGGARHGDFELELYLTPCSPSDPESPVVTWAGTIDFGWRTLGIAFFPTAPLEELDNGWVYFEDELTLFRLPKGKVTDKKLIAAACNPRRELLRSAEAGIGTPMGTGFAAGVTTSARGWWQRYVGGETFWSGYYTSEAGDAFAGSLWLVLGKMS